MTDKEKIRKELERLKEETSIGLSEHENGVEQGRMKIINALSILLDSMQEEPVSEDLEKEIEQYEESFRHKSTQMGYKETARHFAQWQKEQMMAKTVDVDVEVKVDAGGYPYIPQMELYDYDKDIPLAKEGDKYKVVLIKEK